MRHLTQTAAKNYLRITPDVKEPNQEIEQLKQDNAKLTLRVKA